MEERLNTQTNRSPPNYVERAHALLGRTVDQGRVWDIAATAQFLHTTNYLPEDKEEKASRDVVLVGRGQAGILAAYAALFEPSIKEVVIVDPPMSHKDGPIFLNVLQDLSRDHAIK